MTLSRCCPACRLPRPPERIYRAGENALHAVFGVCAACTQRHDRLPRRSLHKLLNGVAVTAARNPDRYWCAVFPDMGAAAVAFGVLTGRPDDCLALIEQLGWLNGTKNAAQSQ